MKMYQLISWFQLEYPELVESMREATHHLVIKDEGWQINLDHTSYYPVNLNPYHLEGNIWEHSLMVCKQAENMPYEVQIAALLHDIGKPSTRAVNPKNGRVSFFNHDAVSAFMSLEILKRKELGLTDEQRVRIFNMIALHTQVYKLTPEQLANIGDMNLVRNLILLGNADHEGRFHSHEGSEIPTFEEIPSYNFYKENTIIEKKKEVIVLVGPPASGKSRWSNLLEKHEVRLCKNEFFWKEGKGLVISRDDILMNIANKGLNFYEYASYNESWNKVKQNEVDINLNRKFKEAIQYDKVIIDMTHMSKKSRRRSLSHFGPEYKKKAVVFLTDLPTLFERNENREGKVIGRSVFDKMVRSFYTPTYEEFDEIEYVLT